MNISDKVFLAGSLELIAKDLETKPNYYKEHPQMRGIDAAKLRQAETLIARPALGFIARDIETPASDGVFVHDRRETLRPMDVAFIRDSVKQIEAQLDAERAAEAAKKAEAQKAAEQAAATPTAQDKIATLITNLRVVQNHPGGGAELLITGDVCGEIADVLLIEGKETAERMAQAGHAAAMAQAEAIESGARNDELSKDLLELRKERDQLVKDKELLNLSCNNAFAQLTETRAAHARLGRKSGQQATTIEMLQARILELNEQLAVAENAPRNVVFTFSEGSGISVDAAQEIGLALLELAGA